MRWWAEFVLRWRVPTAVLLLVAIGLSAWAVPKTRLDMGIGSLVEGDQAAWDRLHDDLDRLPRVPPARFYCTLTWPKPITKVELRWLEDLTTKIDADDRVGRVLSLANVPVLRGGGVLPQPFPKTVGERSIQDAVAEHPLLSTLR